MATLELTSNSEGNVVFDDTTRAPVFIVIGDSIAQGTLNAQLGADRIHDQATYDCRNFNKTLSTTYLASTALIKMFDQWMYDSGTTWDITGTGVTFQGRNYSSDGAGTGFNIPTPGATTTCRARSTGDVAAFNAMNPYMGARGDRDVPTDINVPDHYNSLRDNNFLWTFGIYNVLNEVFQLSNGAGAVPHFINYTLSASGAGELIASLRRASWSPDYAAAAADNTTAPSAYEVFHDMYLKPAIAALPAGSYIAGIIVILGSNDSTDRANNPSTTLHTTCNGRDIPARRLGAELVAIVDDIKTELAITNVPTMYANPVITTNLEAGEASFTGTWLGVAKQSITDAIEGDPYAVQFNIDSEDLSSTGVHMHASGADHLGFKLGDLYYDSFVNQATPLSIETPTAPAAYLTI